MQCRTYKGWTSLSLKQTLFALIPPKKSSGWCRCRQLELVCHDLLPPGWGTFRTTSHVAVIKKATMCRIYHRIDCWTNTRVLSRVVWWSKEEPPPRRPELETLCLICVFRLFLGPDTVDDREDDTGSKQHRGVRPLGIFKVLCPEFPEKLEEATFFIKSNYFGNGCGQTCSGMVWCYRVSRDWMIFWEILNV